MSFSPSRRGRNRRRMILARRQEMAASVSGHAGLEYIRDSFAFEKPFNWVITGDRYRTQANDPTIAESLGRDLRVIHGREDDTVIDMTQRSDRVLALESSLEERVLRFDPSVVIIAVGVGDTRIEQRIAECQAFTRMLATIRQRDAVAVVLPPPSFIGDNNDDPRLSRWRDDIADLTMAYDAVLVATKTCRTVEAVANQLRDSLGISSPIARPPAPRPEEVADILSLVR